MSYLPIVEIDTIIVPLMLSRELWSAYVIGAKWRSFEMVTLRSCGVHCWSCDATVRAAYGYNVERVDANRQPAYVYATGVTVLPLSRRRLSQGIPPIRGSRI